METKFSYNHRKVQCTRETSSMLRDLWTHPATDPGELDSSDPVVRSVPEQHCGQGASPNPTVEARALSVEEQSPV